MPELPEVELTLRILKTQILDERLIDFWTDWPKGLKSKLAFAKIKEETTGLKIKNLSRLGKVLFIQVDFPSKLLFAIHLRMSGSLLFGEPKILLKHALPKHTHFKWKFESGRELWFRDPRKLGRVWYGMGQELVKDKYLSSLGPDVLSVRFDEFKKLIARHKCQLKPLLLRQNIIAGLGNITVDESLWSAKLHPKRLVGNLSKQEIASLFSYIQKVLRRIIKAEGNTMRDWILPDGRSGQAVLKWKAYGREGEFCFRCRNMIKRIVVGGRSTHFCPNCQREQDSN